MARKKTPADGISTGRRGPAKPEELLKIRQAAIDAAADMVVITDIDGNIEYVNPAFTVSTGYSAAEVLGKNPRLLKSGLQELAFYEALWQTISSGKIWRGELINRRKNGTLFHEEMSITPVLAQDRTILRYIAIKHDITERKRIESELASIALLVTENPNPVLRIARTGEILSVSRAAETILRNMGWRPGQTAPRELAGAAEAALVENVPGERELTCARGRVFSFLCVPLPEKAYANLYGRDITDRKQAEAQLRTIIENIAEGLVVSDLEGRLLHWNRAALEMHGLSSLEEARRLLPEFATRFELASPDGAVLPVAEWPLSRILRGESLHDVEIRIRSLTAGWRRFFRCGGGLVRDESGRPLLAVLTLVDVTGHRLAEEAVRRANERMELAQRAAGAGTWDWNIGAGRMEGSSRTADLFGLEPGTTAVSVDQWLALVHPRDREAVMTRIEGALKSRNSLVNEYRIVRPDGQLRWISALGQGVYDEQGRASRMTGICIDITERKEAEDRNRWYQERLQSMALELSLTEERERRRLAVNLHDGVIQFLTASKMRVAVLRMARPGIDPAEQLATIDGLLDRAEHAARSLTSQLSPPSLYDLGLAAAAEWLVQDIHNMYGLKVKLHDDSQARPVEERVRVILFQCLRELLVNAAKHARTDEAWVRLSVDDTIVRVAVEDRGVGFDAETVDRQPERAGFGLFSIRERVQHLGGRVLIHSAPGRGTSVMLEVPAGAASEAQQDRPGEPSP